MSRTLRTQARCDSPSVADSEYDSSRPLRMQGAVQLTPRCRNLLLRSKAVLSSNMKKKRESSDPLFFIHSEYFLI